MAPTDYSNVQAVLLDVEGTTTSISFVKDTLFPYVRTNLTEYLNKNWESESLLEDIKLLKEQCNADKESGVEGLVLIEDGDKESLEKNILWQMDQDRKTTALKQLQGHIWKNGYSCGELKAHIFDDVADCMKKWSSDGRRVFIYSSGSVEAQKLLFGNTSAGSLLDIINGNYDTTTGAKQDSKSYATIAKDIGVAADQLIFLTDIVAEAEAAATAGLHAILVDRDGNAPLADDAKAKFTVITSFDQLVFEPCSKRARKDIIEPQKEEKVEPMDVVGDKEANKTETNPVDIKESSEEMEVVDVKGDAKPTTKETDIVEELKEDASKSIEDQPEEPEEDPLKQTVEDTETKAKSQPAEEITNVVPQSEAKVVEAVTPESNEEKTEGSVAIEESKSEAIEEAKVDSNAEGDESKLINDKEPAKAEEPKNIDVSKETEVNKDEAPVLETKEDTNGHPEPTEVTNGKINGVHDKESTTNGNSTNGASEKVEETEEISVKKVAEEAPVAVAVAAE